jgi:hypothetical protein
LFLLHGEGCPQAEQAASDQTPEHREDQLDRTNHTTKHDASCVREHALVVIKPAVFNINRPQRVLVRQTYRALRSGGFSRVRAHMTVYSMLDVGYMVGRTDEQLQRQWGIDNPRPSVGY